MRRLVWIFFLFTALLVFGCVQEVPRPEGYARTYPKIVKGFWMPALASPGGEWLHSVDEPNVMKEFGANVAAFAVALPYDERGDVDAGSFEGGMTVAKNFVRKYHANGVSVFLTIEPIMGFGEPGKIPENISDGKDFVAAYDSLLEKLALMAEEEDVEYFSPMNEPDYKLGAQTDAWSRRMLSVVKKRFTGKIVYKGSLSNALETNQKPEFSGYSYVGVSISPYNPDAEGFRQRVRQMLQTFSKWAKEDGFAPMITEFGIWGPGRDIPEEKKAEAVSIVFEEGMNSGLKTFIVFDSPAGFYTQAKGTSIEPVVKKFFGQLSEN